jgi:beta-lactamase superfamily II metal-dependent hydrolase
MTSSIKKRSLIRRHRQTRQKGTKNIRIRMYRVGFGDSFLLSIPTSSGESTERDSHILIDCGVHSSGDIGTIEKVVQNIGEVTDRKLAIVIATHAHQDHISGFGKFGNMFSKFKVKEVWLPWTWDETNREALKIQKSHAALARQLFQHKQAASKQHVDQNLLNALENLELEGNNHAMELLKSGFADDKVKVRYLKAGDKLKPEEIPIPGLFVRILGPPESEEFLTQMNPPSSQRYLHVIGDQTEYANNIVPFAEKWKCIFRKSVAHPLDESDENILKERADFPLEDLTFTLDQARNNESLVTLFIYRNQNLLFTGDAQYGNWRWWLENTVQYGDILSKINFFKIAHHGSHNATPKAALKKMTDGNFAAMVSTQSKPWDSIPRSPLMAKLNEKTGKRIVRSDWLPIKGAPRPIENAEPPFPSKLPKGFSKGDLWFDYVINLA